ncbi:protein-tyrosine kinase 6 [Gastrophryne carolinensis]
MSAVLASQEVIWLKQLLEDFGKPLTQPTAIYEDSQSDKSDVTMSSPGHRYISQWDFSGCASNELTFKAGDRFQALNTNGDWWYVERINAIGGKTGEKGYVPGNYMAAEGTVEEQPWFFGQLSRTEAGILLMKGGNMPGSFLIRISDKQDFVFALSVRMKETVKHFKILCDARGEYFLNESSRFPSLDLLIDHYKERPIVQGMTLSSPCVKDEPVASDLSPPPLDEWERPREEFTLVCKLGAGNFAQVYEGYWQGRVRTRVAIKAIKQDVTTRDTFLEETAFLKTLRHRNLLSLYAVCSVGDPYLIVTELLSKGDLLTFLRGPEGEELGTDGLLDLAGQVVDGMQYLESKNCIHRDLAARNVLIGQNNICKVADFGLARMIKDDYYITNCKQFPYKWTAPEALAYGRYTLKSDIWSFGVLLFEIMSKGMRPYPAIENSEILDYLTQGHRMAAPKGCSQKVYEVMLECWEENPHKRPTFSELKHVIDNLSNYEPSEQPPTPKLVKPPIPTAKPRKTKGEVPKPPPKPRGLLAKLKPAD